MCKCSFNSLYVYMMIVCHYFMCECVCVVARKIVAISLKIIIEIHKSSWHNFEIRTNWLCFVKHILYLYMWIYICLFNCCLFCNNLLILLWSYNLDINLKSTFSINTYMFILQNYNKNFMNNDLLNSHGIYTKLGSLI